MRRREFITLLGGATAWPFAARAQQPERVRRIGVLMGLAESDSEAQTRITAFRDGLQKLGWTEGRNTRIDIRWATPDDTQSMQRFAKELVALQPDLILSHTTPTTTALLQQTRTIPHRFYNRWRSDWQWLRRELPPAWRQYHRFQPFGTDAGWQVGGTAQGACAAYC
jgi:putative ABC transport system substrate-binding protein